MQLNTTTQTTLDALEMVTLDMMNLGTDRLWKKPSSPCEIRELFAKDGMVPYLPALRPFLSYSKIIFLMHTLQLAFNGDFNKDNDGNIQIKMCPNTTAQILNISPKTQSTLRRFFKEHGILESQYIRKEGVYLITLNPLKLKEFLHEISPQKAKEKVPLDAAPKNTPPSKILSTVLEQIHTSNHEARNSFTRPATMPPKESSCTKSAMSSQDWDQFTNQIPWGNKNDYEQFL